MLSSSNKEQSRRHAIHGIQQSNGKHYGRKGFFAGMVSAISYATSF
jgi:hypothetical protein